MTAMKRELRPTAHIEIVWMSPEWAKSILEKNTKNRPINNPNLKFLKNEMETGRYQFNGDTIAISLSFILLNGQHRLMNCVELQQGFWAIMVTELEDDVFVTIDTGRPRQASDTLSIGGVADSKRMAANTRKIMGFAQRVYRNNLSGNRIKTANSIILEIFKANKDVITEATVEIHPSYVKGQRILPPSTAEAAAAALILSGEDKNMVYAFMREIYSGEKEEHSMASTAAMLLRGYLINVRVSERKLDNKAMVATLFNSFYKYKRGSNAKKYNAPKKDVSELIPHFVLNGYNATSGETNAVQ